MKKTVFTYGVCLQGTDHQKSNTVCQDAYRIVKHSDMCYIAAVADGLGSEKRSDIASKMAVSIAVDYCAAMFKSGISSTAVASTIRESFEKALKAIEDKAEADHGDINQYDTTLSLAIYNKGVLHYGHVGDSGIVVLADDGLYEKVTEQQRNKYSDVFPLCFKDKWVFGTFKKKATSVFLATDGIYDTLFPIYIRDTPVSIHVQLASYFMDNTRRRIDKVGEKAVQKEIESFLRDIPAEKEVSDDKTVVCLINTAITPAWQPDEYYMEPDWNELARVSHEKAQKALYPHLYPETDPKKEG
jgi:serine/threonine protein phosphatase PrpC